MSEYPFVDIHTHSELIPKDVVAIRNVFYGDALNYRFDIKRFYSIGLHPWFIEGADDTFDPAKLEMLAAKPFVMAIGEIGLDSTADIDIEKQSRIFELQLTVAHKLKKPVIIHCVRTISYFIPKFKNNSFKVPVILHGYNCNAEITGSLINKNCFFSYLNKTFFLKPMKARYLLKKFMKQGPGSEISRPVV